MKNVINKIKFRKFLEDNLKHGKKGFEDFTYDFNAYLWDARRMNIQGGYNFELRAYETKNHTVECFYFEDIHNYLTLEESNKYKNSDEDTSLTIETDLLYRNKYLVI